MGDIGVYIEHHIKPIITFKDTTPLGIKYFGFSSLGLSLARFFYDCRGDEVYSISQQHTSCSALETTSSVHNQFIKINNNSIAQPDVDLVDILINIQAPRDVHILFWSNNETNNIGIGYEISKVK